MDNVLVSQFARKFELGSAKVSCKESKRGTRFLVDGRTRKAGFARYERKICLYLRGQKCDAIVAALKRSKPFQVVRIRFEPGDNSSGRNRLVQHLYLHWVAGCEQGGALLRATGSIGLVASPTSPNLLGANFKGRGGANTCRG